MFESAGPPLTVAVLVAWPSRVARARISTVAEPPLAREPSAQFTRFDPWRSQVPWEGVAETKSISFGRRSTVSTPVAASGPAFDHGERVDELAADGHRLGAVGLVDREVSLREGPSRGNSAMTTSDAPSALSLR